MYVIIAVVVFIGSGVLCHCTAKSRHARPVFWGVMGVLFGPPVIMFALKAKPVNKK